MPFAWLTPDIVDALVIGTAMFGLAVAAVRFMADMRRPVLPPPAPPTEPHP